MKKDRRCQHCNQLFENIEGRVFSNHVKWCKQNPNNSYRKETREKFSRGNDKSTITRHGELKWFEVECYRCKTKFCVKEREKSFPKKEKYFCSNKCATIRDNPGPKDPNKIEELREKVRENTKDLWRNPDYARRVMENNKYFTSKGEREVKEYFQETNPDDEWTSGGGINVKGYTIPRDLYSKKLKVVIEYDGIWHFKDIKGQLKDKQTKDRLLEEWCISNGYRLIRIDEDYFQTAPTYWKHILLDEAYNGSKQIVKFGDKY